MNLVNIGKIVNTHGIKGELRLLSDFDKKDIIFKPGFKIYIGENHILETIKSYRKHKNFDMICLENYNNINEVLKYKGLNVYINRDDLNLNNNDYILSDLIDMDIIFEEEYLGKVVDYLINGNSVLLKVKDTKEYYIPLVDEFIIKVDLDNNKIITKNIKGLII